MVPVILKTLLESLPQSLLILCWVALMTSIVKFIERLLTLVNKLPRPYRDRLYRAVVEYFHYAGRWIKHSTRSPFGPPSARSKKIFGHITASTFYIFAATLLAESALSLFYMMTNQVGFTIKLVQFAITLILALAAITYFNLARDLYRSDYT